MVLIVGVFILHRLIVLWLWLSNSYFAHSWCVIIILVFEPLGKVLNKVNGLLYCEGEESVYFPLRKTKA